MVAGSIARQLRGLGAMFRRMAEPNQAEFVVSYSGPAVDDGSMDVHDLAPALLGIGEAFREANRVLNGDRASVSVRVRSDFRTGSFEVDLEVVQSLYEHAKQLMLLAVAVKPLDLMTILGFIGWDVPGAIQILKRLKGQKPVDATPKADGSVELHINGDGNVVVVNAPVARVLEDEAVRNALQRVVAPLERPGLDKLEVKQQGRVVATVEKNEARYFEPPVIDIPDKPLLDTISDAVVQVIRPSFKEKLAWTFSDGESQFSATIEDARFLEQVDRRQVVFAADDAMKVRLRVITKRTAGGKLQAERRVLRVIDILPAPRSGQLPLLAPPQQTPDPGDTFRAPKRRRRRR
jgi:hypothetical protein